MILFYSLYFSLIINIIDIEMLYLYEVGEEPTSAYSGIKFSIPIGYWSV